MTEENAPTVLTLMTDLFFETRVRTSAQAAGVKTRSVRNAEKACSLADSVQPALIVIDLAAAGDEPEAVVRSLRSAFPHARIIAFGSHVDAEALAAAEAGGAHEVMPRSRFSAELDQLLQFGTM